MTRQKIKIVSKSPLTHHCCLGRFFLVKMFCIRKHSGKTQ
uniref:Uncharacterized protein n=1 Tax=Anguilla anguilla TaxID=7936 RepID=A0A0E9R8I1_ANGAN